MYQFYIFNNDVGQDSEHKNPKQAIINQRRRKQKIPKFSAGTLRGLNINVE